MPLHVHFYRITFTDHYEQFCSLLDQDIHITSGEELPSKSTFDVLVHPTPNRQWLEASPNLQAIVIPWAGIPEKTREIMRNYPEISVHNLHHNSFNTAELGFALLLAAAKQIIPLDQALRQNNWEPRYTPTETIHLRGRTALILGYGQIGQALSGYCRGFGMRVMAVKNHPEPFTAEQDAELFTSDKLKDLLPKADVLFIALPLTEKTENMISRDEIALLPQGSILVNIGRGPIVNQFALYDALTSGHLRGAASDVWYNYPGSKEARGNTAPADVPFGSLDNFVLSPHRGGMVQAVEQQRMQALAELINAASRGAPIPNKVDLEAGY